MVSLYEGWAVGNEGVIVHYLKIPEANLEINYVGGAPGSYFTLMGKNFPPNSNVKVKVNWRELGMLSTDSSGSLVLLLNTEQADEGYYTVVVSGNSSASTGFVLKSNEPKRPKEGSGKIFNVPGGIAETNVIFVPVALK